MKSNRTAHDAGRRTAPRRPMRHGLVALAGLLIAPSLTSCVSEAQMRLAVEERDREIATLRSDKRDLQERLNLLTYEKEDLRAQLEGAVNRVPASVRVPDDLDTSAPPSVVDFPELADIGIETSNRAGDTVISVPAEVTFGSGKATLTKDGRAAIQKVAARLKSDFPRSAKFYIEGHTDSDPITKSNFDSNRDLSIKRAMAVLTYLVENGDVPDERFVVVGHGQYAPVASNAGPQKAKNRRVEIVVKSKG